MGQNPENFTAQFKVCADTMLIVLNFHNIPMERGLVSGIVCYEQRIAVRTSKVHEQLIL